MLQKIKANKYFLIFIVVFAYAQSIHSRILIRNELTIYSFTPDAAFATLISIAFLYFILNFIIQLWQKASVFSIGEMLKIFFSSLLFHLVLMQFIGLMVAMLFNNVERNFNVETLRLSSFSYLLDGIIYGSFFLVFYYYKKNAKQQALLATYHKTLYESRVAHLKSQFNPHFLFNNLNVLDQLIYEDKNVASTFLHQFSEIYRYVLHATSVSFVSIEEEIAFAQQYFKLIQYKYGHVFQLNIQIDDIHGNIVPLTIQTLIENAIKHNLATAENPVYIQIKITDQIVVTNNRVASRKQPTVSGKGLNNLKEQYLLLTQNEIKIIASEQEFSVIIPKIAATKSV